MRKNNFNHTPCGNGTHNGCRMWKKEDKKTILYFM